MHERRPPGGPMSVCRSHQAHRAPVAAMTAHATAFLKDNLRDYGMLISLVVIMGVLPGSPDRRHRSSAAAQPHQPHPAEQLRRHHGARACCW